MHLTLFHTQLHYVIDSVDEFMQKGVSLKRGLLPGLYPNNLRLVIILAERHRHIIYYNDRNISAEDTHNFRQRHTSCTWLSVVLPTGE